MSLKATLELVSNKINEWWNSCSQLEQSIIAILLMAMLYLVIRTIILKRMEKIAAGTDNDLDDRVIHFIKQFLWIIAIFLVVILVLRINEIKITPMWAGAGIFGVALGFAAKEALADILSGLFLIADRPVRVGDRVKIENIGRHWGAWGDVVDIGLRRTLIRNTDGVVVNYPNSMLVNSVITNFSFEKNPVRVRVRFQVAYHADLELCRRVALEAINKVEGVIPDTAQLVVRSLWDDDRGHLMAGVLLEARYRIEDVRKRTVIRSAVLASILDNLQQARIPLAAQPVQLIKSEG